MKATFAAKSALFLFLALLASACNKNKDTFLNRKYQNMVARYNVYFNGTQKLNETLLQLEKSHKDDFSKVLDVYPYGSEQDRKSQAGNMDEVIKKASKVIADRPISKWVDDAYLLMGKAYFFKADYFAAIETFQFLNSQYKDTRISYEATLWIIKSYVMLGKEREAEAIIGLLNNDPKFPEKLKPALSEVSAYVYIREERYKAALEHMEKALVLAKGSSKRARYHYILGQLYDRMGDRKNARLHFKIVTKGAPPYEMAFNAKINLARNYNPANPNEIKAARKYLKSMLRDDKNISYFPQIYYELGLIEKKEGNLDQSIAYFQESNNHNSGNKDQKALCFLEMADIFFEKPNYRQAQLYYDSAVYFIQPDYKDYDALKAKQEVLSELVKNLILIQREDSLLKVAELPQKEIDKLVDKAIEEEKKRQEELKKQQEEKQQQPQFNNPMVPNTPFNQPKNAGGGAGSFYFADPILVARGYNDFVTRYGERKNSDNWQFSAIANKVVQIPDGDPDGEGNQKEGDPEKPGEGTPEKKELDSAGLVRQKYYNDIPFSDEAKRNSRERIAEALLNTGEIYYEQLKELKEAENYFRRFTDRFSSHEDMPKALYYLYKINTDAGKEEEAKNYKAKLIMEFPDSPYARFLTNDKSGLEDKQAGLDPKILEAYKSSYELFKKGQYREVIKSKKEFDLKYYGSVIQPKYDFLEAVSYGKIDSMATCISKLEALLSNYPTSEEALEAQRIINAYKRKQSQDAIKETTSVPYAYNPGGKHYFLMLIPENKKVSMNQLKARFSDFNRKEASGYSLAIDEIIVGNRQILVVKEFINQEEADKYRSLVTSNQDFLKSLAVPRAEFMVADPKNLGLMVVNSDLKGFLTFQSTYYTK